MAEKNLTFPKDFHWGTATAAHQIEGGNTNSDWWRLEHTPGGGTAESSGDACDSWNRYEEDIAIVASLGMNAYRFSVEWARIEPAEGEFSKVALDHYRDVLFACRNQGILPVVTMHHFTLPQWVQDAGGFESPNIVSWMARYAGVVGEALGDLIGVACTINEPNIVAITGFLMGMFPPQVQSWDRFSAVNTTMRACHVAIRDALRAGPGSFPIGIALSMQEWEAVDGAEDSVASMREEMEDLYLRAAQEDDFIGVQCYTKMQIGPQGMVPPPPDQMLDMGYYYWPQCVEHTVRRASDVAKVPVIVTENGIGTTNDQQRIEYLEEAISGLHRAISDGVEVHGYFQWSLLDNFEWLHGYRLKFGIVEVDRETFERTPKPSAHWYGELARTGVLKTA